SAMPQAAIEAPHTMAPSSPLVINNTPAQRPPRPPAANTFRRSIVALSGNARPISSNSRSIGEQPSHSQQVRTPQFSLRAGHRDRALGETAEGRPGRLYRLVRLGYLECPR